MFEGLPGFRDFYPEDCLRRNFIFKRWTQIGSNFGFQEYDIPTLESLDLFTEKSGPEIVSQLFHFEDQGGRKVSLRPELTPSLARMVGSKASSLKRPIKWFNIAENFRYERQQKGRLRSHYQLNGDIFGEPGTGADAEVISFCLNALITFGLKPTDIKLRLSDRNLWVLYLEGLGHESEATAGILSVIDRMERLKLEEIIKKLSPYFGEATEDFIAQLENLKSIRSTESLRSFFSAQAVSKDQLERIETRLNEWESLVSDLEWLGLAGYFQIDLGIVRGLAYYTGFVFEVFALDQKGKFTGRALAGGGRYDHLVEKLGFNALPAVGFGMGDVTLADLLKEKNLMPDLIDAPDIFMVVGGADERSLALADTTFLRSLNLRVSYPLKEISFGKQFKQAGQSGARFAFIYGSEEREVDQVKVRDLKSGGEKSIQRKSLQDEISSILESGLTSG